MKCKVITIKVPLYTYDEDDDSHPRPLTDEEVQEEFDWIQQTDNLMGFTISEMSIQEEEYPI